MGIGKEVADFNRAYYPIGRRKVKGQFSAGALDRAAGATHGGPGDGTRAGSTPYRGVGFPTARTDG